MSCKANINTVVQQKKTLLKRTATRTKGLKHSHPPTHYLQDLQLIYGRGRVRRLELATMVPMAKVPIQHMVHALLLDLQVVLAVLPRRHEARDALDHLHAQVLQELDFSGVVRLHSCASI